MEAEAALRRDSRKNRQRSLIEFRKARADYLYLSSRRAASSRNWRRRWVRLAAVYQGQGFEGETRYALELEAGQIRFGELSE